MGRKHHRPGEYFLFFIAFILNMNVTFFPRNGFIPKMRNTLLILIALTVYTINCDAQTMAGMKMNSHRNIYLLMMDTMMTTMSKTPKAETVDRYFLLQMIPHHEGALAMASYEINHGKNFKMQQVAKNIFIEQNNEIQLMQIWLKSPMTASKVTSAYKREMGQTMATMMLAMPEEKSLNNSDKSFALVMIPHHQAGINMAKVLLKYENQKVLRSYAIQLISDQEADIEQMKYLLKYKL